MLSLFVPCGHAVLSDPGESIGCFCSVLRPWLWPSPRIDRLGTPDYPVIRFRRGANFVASSVRARYGLSTCLSPWRI